MTWLLVALAVPVVAFVVCRALSTVSTLTVTNVSGFARWDRIFFGDGERMRVVKVLSLTQVRVLHRRRSRQPAENPLSVKKP